MAQHIVEDRDALICTSGSLPPLRPYGQGREDKEQKEKENSKFAGEKKDISFGSQIRSYVFQPYTMVKDHRTKYSVGNIQGVMDGDIDGFLDSFLSVKWNGTPVSDDDDDFGDDE